MKSCKKLVYIIDITKFAKACLDKSEEEIFSILDKFYTLVETEIYEAGGKVVKFMGDSALIIFDTDQLNSAELAVKKIKANSDLLWENFNLECRLKIKFDTCSLVCGEMGLHKNFDIVGNDLNRLFMS